MLKTTNKVFWKISDDPAMFIQDKDYLINTYWTQLYKLYKSEYNSHIHESYIINYSNPKMPRPFMFRKFKEIK